MALKTKLSFRPATAADLLFINGIIEAAVMSWKLPERVKRLSVPTYRYDEDSLKKVQMQLASDPDNDVVGVIALSEMSGESPLPDRHAMVLHGVFVDAVCQRQGVGRSMLESAVARVRDSGFDALLVNAQPDALPFFEAMGFQLIPVVDDEQDYKLRYWLAC